MGKKKKKKYYQNNNMNKNNGNPSAKPLNNQNNNVQNKVNDNINNNQSSKNNLNKSNIINTKPIKDLGHKNNMPSGNSGNNVKKNNNSNNSHNNYNKKHNHNSKNNYNKNSNNKNYNNQKNNNNVNKNNNNNQKNKNSNNQQIKKENIQNNNIKNQQTKTESVEKNVENKGTSKKTNLVLAVVLVALICFGSFITWFALNYCSIRMQSNVSIENIDVSNLTKSAAKIKIANSYEDIVNKEIKCSYLDKEYSISLKDIELSFKIDEAIEEAMEIGRNNNIIIAAKDFYSLKLGNEKNIDLNYKYNKEKLYERLKNIEKDFYCEVKQSSYTVDDTTLRIQNGSKGISLDYNQFEAKLDEIINQKDTNVTIELPIKIEEPEEINLAKIHGEVYRDVKNASYTLNPFQIHNEEKGVNFDYKAAKEMIELEPDKQEYEIPLIITEPTIKVENLGLYDSELGSCATGYVNNPNRTNNLRLAASKVDGIILMPGEEFSYNDTVGERTYSAGYRNAAIYINGEVEDGLGGGICQISSTLYNAAVEANLEIIERSNHARVPSYLPAGKDATVYWGSKDFRFKNNREYPIKICASVGGGYATVAIYGTPSANEYEITIETDVVSRYNGWLVVEAYKVYRQNGEVVNREWLSTDEYKIG